MYIRSGGKRPGFSQGSKCLLGAAPPLALHLLPLHLGSPAWRQPLGLTGGSPSSVTFLHKAEIRAILPGTLSRGVQHILPPTSRHFERQAAPTHLAPGPEGQASSSTASQPSVSPHPDTAPSELFLPGCAKVTPGVRAG